MKEIDPPLPEDLATCHELVREQADTIREAQRRIEQLAHVITSKYGGHLPLYRQEDVLARHGVTLSRATLCGWMAQAAGLLKPLYEAMVKRVRSSRVIWTDDTTVPVRDPALPATRAGRFWVYLGDARNPFSVYDFTPRHGRDGPERSLDSYRGYLQADAFAGYDRLCAGPG